MQALHNFPPDRNQDFATDLIDRYPLDRVAKWMADNCTPEEIFTQDQLEVWALDNGFVEEE